MDKKILALKIIERREALGLTPRQLACLADLAPNTVINIESGYGCRVETLIKIAAALGKPPTYFLEP